MLTNQHRYGTVWMLINQRLRGGDSMISRFEQFSFTISTLHRCIQKIEREEMDRYGLRGVYAQYLVALQRHPEGLTAAQLCDICDLDKAAVSRVVAEMEKCNLLSRNHVSTTGYRAKLFLTDAGIAAADYVSRRAQQAVEAAGCDLTDADRQILYTALASISVQLQKISREGLPEA